MLRCVIGLQIDFENHGMSMWNEKIRTSVFTRFDSIVYGSLMAYLKMYYDGHFFKYRFHFLLAGLIIHFASFALVFLSKNYLFAHTIYYSFVGIGFAFTLPFFYQMKIRNIIIVKIVTVISVLSYSAYLVNYYFVHNLVNYFLTGHTLYQCFMKFFIALCSVGVLSLLMFKYIETPFMNLRRFIKS
jgi:peptidoglycan/LPS O-acetylase OafA/YrhL